MWWVQVCDLLLSQEEHCPPPFQALAKAVDQGSCSAAVALVLLQHCCSGVMWSVAAWVATFAACAACVLAVWHVQVAAVHAAAFVVGWPFVRKCWLLVLLIRAASLLAMLPAFQVSMALQRSDRAPKPKVALLLFAGSSLALAAMCAFALVRADWGAPWSGPVKEVFAHHASLFSEWGVARG
jgi:hypothetical protein